jgi:hypothetical protein
MIVFKHGKVETLPHIYTAEDNRPLYEIFAEFWSSEEVNNILKENEDKEDEK